MGDETTPLSPAEARHLLRRTGFGAQKKDVDRILLLDKTRGRAADRLLNFRSTPFRPNGSEFPNAHNKWIKYLTIARSPLQEKLVLFWHDHFATAISKVADVGLMADQIQLLHERCKGNFKDLVKAINVNPAMMEFLDTVRNDKDVPNENYARELQELFTLGVDDTNGNPNYTQEDIVQIARAFTGWGYDRGKAVLDEGNHDFMADFPARGPKVIYQSTGGFGSGGRSFTVNGEGTAEIDTVIDIIFAHRDSNGRNTVARRTARRLLEYFAHPNPDTAVVDAVVAQSGFGSSPDSWDVGALVRAILVHDAFYETGAAAPFGAQTKKSVKWPIDYVVSTLRLLGMRLKGRDQYVDGGSFRAALDGLSDMGQVLLDPPSVFGWDWETSWISSAALLARYGFARDVTSARGHGTTAFRPERLIDLNLTDPAAIVDAVLGVLGIPDQLTDGEKTTLVNYLTENGTKAVDLHDGVKANGLFALVLQSPAYQLH